VLILSPRQSGIGVLLACACKEGMVPGAHKRIGSHHRLRVPPSRRVAWQDLVVRAASQSFLAGPSRSSASLSRSARPGRHVCLTELLGKT
jgi:hypothetical protein